LKSLRYSGWVRFRKSAGHLIGIVLASATRSLALKSLRFSDWVCFANSRDPPSRPIAPAHTDNWNRAARVRSFCHDAFTRS